MTLLQSAESRSRAPNRTSPISHLPILVGGLVLAVAPVLAGGQKPSANQVQQALQQQPGLGDMVRNRISQSGLTAEQIRARLQASGHPASLLDPYLSATPPSGPLPGSQELAALQALGLPSLTNAALPYDTGLVRSARTQPS